MHVQEGYLLRLEPDGALDPPAKLYTESDSAQGDKDSSKQPKPATAPPLATSPRRSRLEFAGLLQRLQPRGKLVVDTPETAVGKNRDYVTRGHLRRRYPHDTVNVRNDSRLASSACNLSSYSRNIQSLTLRNRIRFENICDHDFVGNRKAFSQVILKYIAPQRVRTRLQNCPQTTARITRT